MFGYSGAVHPGEGAHFTTRCQTHRKVGNITNNRVTSNHEPV